MARMTAGVKRVRRSDAPIASTHHQVAEPRRTPATRTAGLAGPPAPPRLSVAASAANERMAAGVVPVKPRGQTYAHGSPGPEAPLASVGESERSERIRRAIPIHTAAPTRADRRPPLDTP